MENLEYAYKQTTIVGIGSYGIEVIDKLNFNGIKGLEFLLVQDLDKEYNNLSEREVLIFILDNSDNKSIDCLLQLIKYNTHDKQLNLVFIKDISNKDELLKQLEEYNCFIVLADDIFDSINNLIKSSYYPGLIAFDFDDIKLLFNNDKVINYSHYEDIDYEFAVEQLIENSSKLFNLQSVTKVILVLECTANLTLYSTNYIVTKIRESIGNNLNIIYSTNLNDSFKYKISIYFD